MSDEERANFEEQEGEEEIDSDEEEIRESQKDSILFLIDAGTEMFSHKLDEGLEPFFLALKAAVMVYCDKIISSSSDFLGLVFYGTKEKKNQFDFENIYIESDLSIPNAQMIKSLESMIENKDVERLGSSKTKVRLDEALWTCQHLFSHLPKTVGYKRIFLFTNDENPSTSEHVKKCVDKAKELAENDISIELFILKKKEVDFKFEKFWSKIVLVSDEDYTGRVTFDYAQKIKEIKDKVRRKEFKKRTYSNLEWNLGPNVNIAIGLYTSVHKTTKPSAINLQSENNKPVKTQVKQIDSETGDILLKNDILKYYMYGGKKAIFTNEEIKKIKKIGDKGLKLMGFKDKSKLKDYHNFKSSLFAYPNDFEIKGSLKAFAALHKKMIEMDKIAICRLIERETSLPTFVALLPCKEVLDEDNHQIQAPGFHVIYLPYADGIRKIKPIDEKVEPLEKQVLKAKKMIQKLYIDFNSLNFENPALQKHYSSLQAMALEQKNVEEIQDLTLPDHEGMKKYQSVVEEFKESIYPKDFEIDESKYKTKKRKVEEIDERPIDPNEPKLKATKRPNKKVVERKPRAKKEDKPKKSTRKSKKESEDEEEEVKPVKKEERPKKKVKKEESEEEEFDIKVVKKEEEIPKKKVERKEVEIIEVKKESIPVTISSTIPSSVSQIPSKGKTPVKSRRKEKEKKKKEEITVDQDEDEEIDIVKEVKNNTIERLSSDILREFLELYKLDSKGTKKELIEKITEYLRKRKKI